MVPKLKQAAEETELKMNNVEIEKGAADVLADGISREEAIVQIEVNKANKLKNECEGELAKAIPALQAAESALNVIEKKDIDFLKQMRNPVNPIKQTMHAVCLILYPNPTEKRKEELRTVVDWWAASIKLLGNTQLLNMMKNYDKENMEEKIVVSLRNYFEDPEAKSDLEESVVKNASSVCHSMLLWAKAMYDFYFVYKIVKPKKIALAEANHKVEGLMSQLRLKQSELKKANDKVEELSQDL